MKTIYFIRHAQNHANAGDINLPERDIPLSDLSKQQMAELVFRLHHNK